MRLSNDVVRKAIARGVQNGLFGYATGRPILGEHGRYQLDWSRIAFGSSPNFPVKSPYGSPGSVKLLVPPTCFWGGTRFEVPRFS